MSPAAENLVGHPAGIATRAFAYLLDLLIAFGSYLLILVVGSLAWNLVMDGRLVLSTKVDVGNIWTAGFLVYWVLYLWFWWGLDGASPGKALSGVRLVRLDGTYVGRFTALLRAVLYVLLPPPLFSSPFVILTRQRRGLHDIVCRTRVVYDWGRRPVRPRARPRLRVRDEPAVVTEREIEAPADAPPTSVEPRDQGTAPAR